MDQKYGSLFKKERVDTIGIKYERRLLCWLLSGCSCVRNSFYERLLWWTAFWESFSHWLGLTALGAERYFSLPFPFCFAFHAVTDCHFSSFFFSDELKTTIFITWFLSFYFWWIHGSYLLHIYIHFRVWCSYLFLLNHITRNGFKIQSERGDC